MNNTVDVSVVLNAHKEGRLMHASLRSACDAIEYGRKQGLSCELIVVLDSPDSSTERFCSEFLPSQTRLVNTSVEDLGLARNAGVDAALGTFVAFLDADDLWVQNWLTASFEFMSTLDSEREFILHPEFVVYFEGDSRLWKLLDQEQVEFSQDLLFEYNPWHALSFSKSETCRRIPFRPSNLQQGFGYEDWLFHCDSIAAGVVHKIVPGTMHCLRQKTWKRSLLKDTQSSNAVIAPSPLFDFSW